MHRTGESTDMKTPVDIDQLTDTEIESFVDAQQTARGILPAEGFVHSVPIRDEHGAFSEVRVFDGSMSGGRLLTVVPVRR